MLGGLPRTLFACCKLSNLPYDADGAALDQWLVLSAYRPCHSVTDSQAWVVIAALSAQLWSATDWCSMLGAGMPPGS